MMVLKTVKFRTVILIGSLAAMIMILAVGGGIHLVSQLSDKMTNIDRRMNRLVLNVSELAILAHEYLLFREERPRLQWQSRYQDSINILNEIEQWDLPYQREYGQIRKHAGDAAALFERLCRLHQRTTELSPIVKEGLQERVRGQFLATIQTLLTQTTSLTEMNAQWLQSRRQQAYLSMMVAVMLLALFIAGLFQFLGGRITRHLAMLNEGVINIANGQLEQYLVKPADDEIGQLADGINNMCHQLNQITVSREALAAEIEERKQVETALRRERDLMQSYVQVAAFLLLVMDRQGRVVFINQEGCRVLGYRQKELLEQDWFETCSPVQERDRMKDFFNKIIAEQQPMPETYYNATLTKAGEIRWISWRNVLLRDSQGMPYGSLSSGMDITERLKDERALREAKEEAERANQAKSLFLASMSHELRTPLNGVLGLIRLLSETPLDDIQRDYVTTINESGEALLHIINDILDLSKIEAGRLEMEQVEFDVRQVVGNVLTLMAVRCREKGLSLHKTIDPQVPILVVGDPVRLQQIMFNLVGNASKFTTEGSISAHVEVESRQGKPMLRFTITDTGIGVPPETLQHLFVPFKQGDSSINRRYGGTGLGLVISRQLVQAMGGDISLESTPGHGTTARFYIPLLVQTESKPLLFEQRSSKIKGALTLLLVEDDPISTMAAKGLLIHQGHKVDAAASAEEAFRYLADNRYDAIIMDVHLPGMNGDEATRRIRAMDNGAVAHLPVIGLTANAFYEERTGYMAAGMDAVLAKPASPERLLAAISLAMEKSKGEFREEDAPK